MVYGLILRKMRKCSMIYTKKNARSLLNVQFLCMDRSKGRVAGLQTIRSAWTPTGTIWTAIPANPLADGTLSDISLLALPLMAFSHFHPNFLLDCPAISLGKSGKFFVGCQIQISAGSDGLTKPHRVPVLG